MLSNLAPDVHEVVGAGLCEIEADVGRWVRIPLHERDRSSCCGAGVYPFLTHKPRRADRELGPCNDDQGSGWQPMAPGPRLSG